MASPFEFPSWDMEIRLDERYSNNCLAPFLSVYSPFKERNNEKKKIILTDVTDGMTKRLKEPFPSICLFFADLQNCMYILHTVVFLRFCTTFVFV